MYQLEQWKALIVGRVHIHVVRTIEADPAAIWRLLGDSSTWPSWTPIESFALERPGDADGVGEIRVFRTGRLRVREEVVEIEPNRRLSYVLLSGLAVRGYRAQVDLAPSGVQGPAATDLRWHTTFSAKLPGSGWLYRRAIARATQEFVAGLATHAGEARPTPETVASIELARNEMDGEEVDE